METISIKLPDDLLAKIHYAAKTRGETRSPFIRESVEDSFLKTPVGKTRLQRTHLIMSTRESASAGIR
jgi:metal-responsive CopG/Arc/MetJ family transcriptional regulator